jgi:hypothetical protein
MSSTLSWIRSSPSSTLARIMINLFRGVIGRLGLATGNAEADLSELKKAFLGYLDQKGLR